VYFRTLAALALVLAREGVAAEEMGCGEELLNFSTLSKTK